MSDRIENWIVAPDAGKIRLDQFVAGMIPGESRSQVQNWIRQGRLVINGEKAKTGRLTKPGDRIELRIPAAMPVQPAPEEIPLDILYEDVDLAVVNKPAGMACHAGAGVRSGTLVNALLHRMGPLDAGDAQRPGIVHRLDKFTSGVMLVAKNQQAHRRLSEQFKNREVRKEYLALVYGVLSPAAGTIDVSLGRDPNDRKKISPRARHKRTAVTHYRVREVHGSVSFLDVRIETGRTHQIRVHLAHKGHPIVGDALYGAGRNLPAGLRSAGRALERPFLHAHRIEFHHPRTGVPLSFTAPLAPELERFLRFIRDSRVKGTA